MHYVLGENETPKFYTEFGSFIHKLLEKYFKVVQASKDYDNPDSIIEQAKRDMKLEFYLKFSEEIKGERPPGDIVSNYINKLSNYLDSLEPIPYDIIEVEKKVEFKIGEYNFVGFIDVLAADGEDLIIIDHKSRELKPRSKRKKPTQKDQELDIMLRQQYLYAGAIKQLTGKFPTKLCFNCFKAGVFIEEPFKEEAYDEAVAWALSTINEIKECDDFYPWLEFFQCRWLCGLSEECCYNDRR